MGCKINYTSKRYQTFALSTEEGIFISSSSFKDAEQPMSAFVTRNSEGDIVAQIQNESVTSAHDDWKKDHQQQVEFARTYVKVFQVLFSLLPACIALIRVPFLTFFAMTFWIVSLFTNALYNISCYFTSMIYGKIVCPVFARYHGAEHMAFHAEAKYNRVPTISEISQESMYDTKCSKTATLLIPTVTAVIKTFIITLMISISSMLIPNLLNSWLQDWKYSFIFVPIVVLTILAGKFLNELPQTVEKWMENEKFLKFFQWAVVSKPSNDELDIAQQAIRLRYMMNEKIEQDLEGYVIEDVSFDLLHKKAVYTFVNGQTGTGTLLDYINEVLSILYADVIEVDDESDENQDSNVKK